MQLQNKENTMKHKTAYLGIFTAVALICSYIETLFPIPLGIPGVKLGLPNIVTVWILYLIGTREALLVSILRILLSGFLFGNLFSIFYSLAGGILSLIVMVLLKKTNLFRIVIVSIAGGITHNVGQWLLASVLVETYEILYYLPILVLAGTLTGFVIGMISQEFVIRLKPWIH